MPDRLTDDERAICYDVAKPLTERLGLAMRWIAELREENERLSGQMAAAGESLLRKNAEVERLKADIRAKERYIESSPWGSKEKGDNSWLND